MKLKSHSIRCKSIVRTSTYNREQKKNKTSENEFKRKKRNSASAFHFHFWFSTFSFSPQNANCTYTHTHIHTQIQPTQSNFRYFPLSANGDFHFILPSIKSLLSLDVKLNDAHSECIKQSFSRICTHAKIKNSQFSFVLRHNNQK